MNAKSVLSFIIQGAAFLTILYSSYLLIMLSLPFLAFERNVDFLATKQLIYHIDAWRISFYVHVLSSPLIIIAGLMQFSPWLMRKSMRLHRISGYVYILVLLLISGPAAMIMAVYANGGYPAQTSFAILTSFWILTTYLAYRTVRKHNYEKHVCWMIRSYALTLSAVTLRFYAYLFDVINLELGPKETYILLAYSSWIPNLIVAEIIIRLGYPKYLLNRKSKT